MGLYPEIAFAAIRAYQGSRETLHKLEEMLECSPPTNTIVGQPINREGRYYCLGLTQKRWKGSEKGA